MKVSHIILSLYGRAIWRIDLLIVLKRLRNYVKHIGPSFCLDQHVYAVRKKTNLRNFLEKDQRVYVRVFVCTHVHSMNNKRSLSIKKVCVVHRLVLHVFGGLCPTLQTLQILR